MKSTPLARLYELLTDARDRACELRDRPPSDPRAVAAQVEAIAIILEEAIGGPTDPNKPAGG